MEKAPSWGLFHHGVLAIVDAMSATSDDSRATCTPCRGTGKLVSGLGGEPHDVVCPWCGGSGEFQSGRDAQQAGPAGGA
jgi:DnaJ-class molecular chaperone